MNLGMHFVRTLSNSYGVCTEHGLQYGGFEILKIRVSCVVGGLAALCVCCSQIDGLSLEEV